jgi:hypothetical protein
MKHILDDVIGDISQEAHKAFVDMTAALKAKAPALSPETWDTLLKHKARVSWV